MAVKITLVPEQIVEPVFVVMLTEGVRDGFTVTVEGADVAEQPLPFVNVTE